VSAKLEELPEFDSTELKRRAGGKLRDVQVLVARAHSMMSPTEFMELRIIVNDPFAVGNFARNLERFKKLAHVFDIEHPKSLPLLNSLVGQLAEASGLPHHVADQVAQKVPISEEESRTSDHIQAAGWAALSLGYQ
jgi:hypothetical protein